MSRLAIALVLTLAATIANAQDIKLEQSQTPAVASGNGLRPFLFDGRMPSDGTRRKGTLANDRRPDAGTIITPPEASQPERAR